jgi:hypothetical protein
MGTGSKRTQQQQSRQPSGDTNYFSHNSSTRHGHQHGKLKYDVDCRSSNFNASLNQKMTATPDITINSSNFI